MLTAGSCREDPCESDSIVRITQFINYLQMALTGDKRRILARWTSNTCNVRHFRIALVSFILLLGIASLTVAVTAVPDARMTVDTVSVSPDTPHTDEQISFDATIANSGGSSDPIDITSVELLVRGPGFDDDPFVQAVDTEVVDEVRTIGALSPGDTQTVLLTTQLDDPGEYQFMVRAHGKEPEEEVENEDGFTETVQEEVVSQQRTTVSVNPARVELGVRAVPLKDSIVVGDNSQQQEESTDGGGTASGLGGGNIQDIIGDNVANAQASEESAPPAESPVLVTVTNPGTVTADKVTVTPIVGGQERSPFVTADIPPGENAEMMIDLGTVESQTDVTLLVEYTTAIGTGETETTLVYPPRNGDIRVTDANVEKIESTETGDRVRITANIGNAGGGELHGTVASLQAAEGVTPVYPTRSFFIGTVGPDDFVATELTAVVNATEADGIPVRVTYTDRGIDYTDTVVLPYEPPETDDENEDLSVSSLTIGTVLLTLTLLGVGGILRRRYV